MRKREIAPVALVLALTATMSVTRAAQACSVVGGLTEEDHRNSADLVFTGTAVRVDDPTNGVSFSSMDPLYWTFVIDGVEKGEAQDRVTVASAISGASFGFEFQLGMHYRVYASESGREAT